MQIKHKSLKASSHISVMYAFSSCQTPLINLYSVWLKAGEEGYQFLASNEKT